MDDIGQRLRDAADNCIKAYEAWSSSKKDFAAREALQENVHELRKVSARLEIEVAASERDDITQRQIPIPPHRASRYRGGAEPNGNSNLPDFAADHSGGNDSDDSVGNSVEGSESSSNNPRPRSNPNNQGRSMQPRQQHRRPMRRPEGGNE